MEERGFSPRGPEDEFKNPLEQEKKEDGKKKRKKRFEKLLNLLIPKKTEDAGVEAEPEEPSKAEKFFEASKNLFGKILGIEREDIPEEQEESTEDHQEPRTFRLGGLFAPTEAEDTPKDISDHEPPQAEEDDSLDSYNENPTPERDEPVGVEVNPLEERAQNVETTDYAEIPELPDLDRDEPTDAEVYEPINRAEQHVIIDRSEGSGEVRENTIIDRRGGAGAALVGFVAAEALSRSRDKKIRKEAKELSKKVDKNQKEQEAKNLELEELQRKQRRELEDLQKKRWTETTLSNTQKREVKKVVHENQEVPRVVAKPESKVNHPETSPIPVATERPSQPETQHDNEEKPSRVSERLHLEEVEQAAENDIPIESFYEKRHEVKDDATIPVSAISVPSTPSGTNYDSKQYEEGIYSVDFPSSSPTGPQKQQTEKNDSLYANAVKQGAIAGVAVIVALIIVIIIWRLL